MSLTQQDKKKLQESLSLEENGGIYYEGVRIPVSGSMRWLLVGIGGMGTATLIRLKHEIMSRMQLPKDINGKPTGQLPENIRILAVDSEYGSLEKVHYADTKFDSAEMLYIGAEVPNHKSSWQTIVDGMYHDKKHKKEYTRFLPPEGAIKGLPNTSAAGEMRLLGRVGQFYNHQNVESTINNVIGQLNNASGTTQICLFAGLGGGTGSGSFIDIAFLLKQMTTIGGVAVPLSAYLYLPDLQDNDPAGKDGRAINTFAALKELDQIIRLDTKNESYQYGNGASVIEAKRSPFDYCYLINATDTGNITHKKEEVLSDVAESVFELIADQTTVGGATSPGISAINDNAVAWFVNIMDRVPVPATYRYMSTCSSVRRIPYLEINTLTVSRMFEELNNAIFRKQITDESFAQDLQALGFDNQNIQPGMSLKTAIEDTLMSMLTVDTPASAEMTPYKKPLFGAEYGRYRMDEVWSDGISTYQETIPYQNAYQVCARYQAALNANLSQRIGCTTNVKSGTLAFGENIGSLESAFKSFILNALVDRNRGPVYLRNVVGFPQSDSLINIFKGVGAHCREVYISEARQAAEAIEDNVTHTGAKFVFEEERGKRKVKQDRLETFLSYVDQWQRHQRSADCYYFMSKLCEAIVSVYQKYYDRVIEPLTDTVLTLRDIFRENLRVLSSREESYEDNVDKSLLITPMGFEKKYKATFDECVNNAQNAFLAFLRNNTMEWIGTVIDEKTDVAAKCIAPSDVRQIRISDSLSKFISGFLNALYSSVSVQQIYLDKFGTDFNVGMLKELQTMYQNVHPFFYKNGLDTTQTVQEYTILYIPKTNNAQLQTVVTSMVADPNYNGKIMPIYSDDVSRISMVKVGEGYALLNNALLKQWETKYEMAGSNPVCHLSYEWRKNFPSPRVETLWNGEGDFCAATHDRNEKYRSIFRYCCELGLIRQDPNNPLEAVLRTSAETILGQSAEEYLSSVRLKGTTIREKTNNLQAIFENVWPDNPHTQILLEGMGTYKNHNASTKEDRLNNIMETVLLNSVLCAQLEKEYHLLKKYELLRIGLQTPEYYVKAWAVSVMKYNSTNFNTSLVKGPHERRITTDDNIRMEDTDFDYRLYCMFESVIDETAYGEQTWRNCIDNEWKIRLNTGNRTALSSNVNIKVRAFQKAMNEYKVLSKTEADRKQREIYENIADFYQTCLLYADRLLKGIVSDAPKYYIMAKLCGLLQQEEDSGEYILCTSESGEQFASLVNEYGADQERDDFDYLLYTHFKPMLEQAAPAGGIWKEVIAQEWENLLYGTKEAKEEVREEFSGRIEVFTRSLAYANNCQDGEMIYFYSEGLNYLRDCRKSFDPTYNIQTKKRKKL